MPKNLKCLFIFFVFLIYANATAQDKVLDSLKRILQNPKIHDTTRLDALAGLLDVTFYLDPQSKKYNQHLGAIASRNLRQKELDPVLRTTYLRHLAMYYNNLGNYEQNEQANVYLDKSIRIAKSIGHYGEAHGTLISKGGNCAAIGDNYQAIQCFFKALKYFEVHKDQDKDKEQIISVLYLLGGVYHNLENEKEAIRYYKKVLAILPTSSNATNYKAHYSTVNTNMGTSYMALKQYRRADFHFKEALKIARENQDRFSTGIILTKIGLIQQKSGNLEAAFSLYQQAAELSTNAMSDANVQTRLGEYYYLTKKYAQAEQHLVKAYDLSAGMGNNLFMRNASELLHKVYKENGNYVKAYEMLSIYNRIKDSSKVEVSRNELVEQELKHDYEKKALNHQLETQKKNNLLIGLSGTLLLLFLGGWFLYRNSKQKQRIAAFEKTDLKQKLLLSQMNPHFVFNSIDNIKSLIYNKKDDQAVDYLTRFSKLTRQILENSNEGYISLEEEIAMLENYLSIQQLLYSYRFTFTIDVAPVIDTESVYVPPMLTQPFIENAIKHGLKHKPENGKVAIRFYKMDSRLFFEVTDNGSGFVQTENEITHKSLAVAMTKERLIHYTKKKDFEWQIENLVDAEQRTVGARINFEIPYIYEN